MGYKLSKKEKNKPSIYELPATSHVPFQARCQLLPDLQRVSTFDPLVKFWNGESVGGMQKRLKLVFCGSLWKTLLAELSELPLMKTLDTFEITFQRKASVGPISNITSDPRSDAIAGVADLIVYIKQGTDNEIPRILSIITAAMTNSPGASTDVTILINFSDSSA